jgi:hypothetical protein
MLQLATASNCNSFIAEPGLAGFSNPPSVLAGCGKAVIALEVWIVPLGKSA